MKERQLRNVAKPAAMSYPHITVTREYVVKRGVRHLGFRFGNKRNTTKIDRLDIISGIYPLNEYSQPLKQGINVVTFGYVMGNDHQIINFPTTNQDTNISKSLAKYIDSLAKGMIVMVVANCLNMSKISLEDDAFESLTLLGSKYITNFKDNNDNDCWFIFMKKGTPSVYTEMAFNHSTPCTSSIYFNMVIDETINIYVTTSTPTSIPSGMSSVINVSLGGVPASFTSHAGLLMAAISEDDGRVYFARNYDVTSTSSLSTLQMITDIMSITVGTLVVICTGVPSQDFAISYNLAFAISTLGAKTTICSITSATSYAVIGRKGSPGSVPENLSITGPVTLFTNFKRQYKPVKPYIHIKAVSYAAPTGPSDPSYIFINGLPVYGTFGNGLNVVAINPTNSTVIFANNYDTSDETRKPRQSLKFTHDITDLPEGTIVALSTMGRASDYLADARATVSNYLGSYLISSYTDNQSFCLISTVGLNLTGDARVMSECLAEGSSYTTCDLRFPLKSLYTNPGHTFCVTSGQESRIMVNNLIAINDTTNGINLVAVDPALGTRNSHSFNTSTSERQWEELYSYIQWLPIGEIVLLSVQQSMGTPLSPESKRYQMMAFTMIGACQFICVGPESTYSVIGTRGACPGSAFESYNAKNVQVCVGSWEPMTPASLMGSTQFGVMENESPLFTVPMLTNMHQHQSPMPIIPNNKAYGNLYRIEPAFNWKSPHPDGRRVKALLVGVSYYNTPSQPSKDIEFHIQEHARALIQGGYVLPHNIRILTEGLTEVSDDGTYVNGPSWICIKNEIFYWLLEDAKTDDSLYFVFVGRGFTSESYPFGLVTMTKDLKAADLNAFTIEEFKYCFSSLSAGVNLTLLLDCSYSSDMLSTWSPGILLQTTGLFATSPGNSIPPATQQTIHSNDHSHTQGEWIDKVDL
ncbi:hypothetical protein SAMD00019534_064870 [Acytostelium subglobosum LB1]|uniref:hypothetical protein n=1 Tax=Acytostelium subglobosum LB1 TaxID=1410327 RepID=UPI000644D80E|nr:hypothetical protein SAMD00019534_064870 [Acytostelium subglobosum LB1]GAM23312.1 hypothetical protein SAMD00019534_064870 [Acytostelium subglobosum LB1]|eukprot:XP_012753761.1 hypothetical protein SAMD00019534_064870 [Acytostelium subglobosum LB1]